MAEQSLPHPDEVVPLPKEVFISQKRGSMEPGRPPAWRRLLAALRRAPKPISR